MFILTFIIVGLLELTPKKNIIVISISYNHTFGYKIFILFSLLKIIKFIIDFNLFISIFFIDQIGINTTIFVFYQLKHLKVKASIYLILLLQNK